jgi:hypothetical protein
MIEAMDESAPRSGSQGSGPHPVEIVAYGPVWPAWFAMAGRQPRDECPAPATPELED